MPVYEVICDKCGPREELVKISERDSIRCSVCGLGVWRILSPVTTVGIVWDNRIELPHIGRTFQSNSEMRQYEKENPGFAFMSKTSPEWQKKLSRSRNRVEKLAKRAGYRDWEDMQTKQKAEKKKKAEKPADVG